MAFNIPSMKILSYVYIATAIAVFVKFVVPPFLNEITFVFVIIFTYAAAAAAKTATPPENHHDTDGKPTGKPHSSGVGIRFLRRLGSKIYVAEVKTSDGLFAAKIMEKSTEMNEVRARTELEILKMLDHPFLPKLHASIDSAAELCLLTEFCPAGNLNGHRLSQPLKRFPESAVRFYAAEVVVALEYLHMMRIVHRDIKPENILIRRDGHIILTNFHLSLKCDGSTPVTPEPDESEPESEPEPEPEPEHEPYPKKVKKPATCRLIPSCFRPMKRKPKKNKAKPPANRFQLAEPFDLRSRSFVGTHEFMAPEMVEKESHGSAVDWWGLGILIYEMFYGTTPFVGSDGDATMDNILVKAVKDFPKEPVIPAAAKSLMKKLLKKDPAARLGSTDGASAVKSHRFFEGVNWALLRSEPPPFVPHPSVNNYCYDSYDRDSSSCSSIEFY